MKKNNIILIVVLIIVVIGISFVSINKNKVEDPSLREEILKQEEQRPEITLDVKHQYKNEEHVFVGSLELPTPCHSINSEIIKNEESLELKITTVEPVGDTMCIQVIADKTFKAIYKSANENEKFIGTLNGEKVNLNIFEVGPDDNIDDLELFLKG